MQEPPRMLPKEGENIFQRNKALAIEAEERGIELVRLSIGQPEGWPLEIAMETAAEAIMTKKQSMHEYQDSGTPGVPGFCEDFIQVHLRTSLEGKNVAYLPTTGSKPTLTMFSDACGGSDRKLTIATMTNPGYPTPKDIAGGLRHHNIIELPLTPENKFRFWVADIPEGTDLVMINYPHNPSGQVATREQLEELCEYCQEKGIRLVNDAAYIALSNTPESSTLADVAVNYPGLSWVELFSSSKIIGNATGWRIGAAVGSPNFIADLGKIKGLSDSGFAAPLAAGVLYAVQNDREGIEANRLMYERRLDLLTGILIDNGLRLAIEPAAGFFTLWKSPRRAFGEKMIDAEDFNRRMVFGTGIIGVPFHPYMRYAVCVDVEAVADKIDAAFKKAAVSY